MDGDPLLGQIVLQIILILINAFFAMSEIAVLSVSDAKVRVLIQGKKRGAIALEKLLAMPARFLATIQVGVTLAGFLGAGFASDNLAPRLARWMGGAGVPMSAGALQTLSVVACTVVLSFFTLVLGELVPKRFAMQKPVAISLAVASVVHVFSILARPVVAFLTLCVNGVLRLMRIDPHATQDSVTEEEIRMMVGKGEETGMIEENEKVMIENVFNLNNTIAGEVMTHRTKMVAISLEDTDDEILGKILESGLSRFPVYDADVDDIIGILRGRDYLLDQLHPGAQNQPLKELLMAPFFVPETLHTDMLLREMQQRKTHIAVVLDEYGGTSGVVTMEDLLEEIVGNIYDESDKYEDDEVRMIEENVFRVPGNISLDELGELFDIKLEDDDVDTLSGMVFKLLNEIPEDGTSPVVAFAGLEVFVEKIKDRRVRWAIVALLPQATQAEGAKADKGEEMNKHGAGFL